MNQEPIGAGVMQQERANPREIAGRGVAVSAVVPVTERFDDPIPLYREYRDGVAAAGMAYEFIYVLDGEYPEVLAALQELKSQGEPIKIIKFAKWFGEANALNAGAAAAAGDIILTLPAYRQVKAAEIPRLLDALETCDVAVGRRWPRGDSKFNLLQARVFHRLLKLLLDSPLSDLGCGARALKRQVIDELNIYGDQHRFLPLLAERQGFTISEVNLAQDQGDLVKRVYPFGVYVRRVLDLLSIFFLVKFTRKPLRFFGLIGLTLLAVGSIMTLWLIVERLFFGLALADRPALILSTLMVVLGIQVISVGLIGEIVIFTRAKESKEYNIDEIIE